MKSQSLQSFLQRAKANGTPIPSSLEMSLALDVMQERVRSFFVNPSVHDSLIGQWEAKLAHFGL